jgi:hypothetical protein
VLGGAAVRVGVFVEGEGAGSGFEEETERVVVASAEEDIFAGLGLC